MTRLRFVVVICAVAVAGRGAAQTTDSLTVEWAPADPVQGAVVFFRVQAHAADGAGAISLQGQLAGQALHFDRLGDGSFVALGGIPIGSGSAQMMRLTVMRGEDVLARSTREVPVRTADYPVDRLTVASRFGQTPDSATRVRIARERRRETEAARRAHTTARLWSGPFARPRPGRVTSGYGRAREFNGTIQSRHMGVDIDGVEGAPVRAAHRGVVSLIGDHYYSGNLIYLDHGAGLVTAYRHLSRVEVAEGDTVEQGQLIGRVGATGRVTGPHLHWTVRYGTLTVDGLSLLELDLPGFQVSSSPPSPRD